MQVSRTRVLVTNYEPQTNSRYLQKPLAEKQKKFMYNFLFLTMFQYSRIAEEIEINFAFIFSRKLNLYNDYKF